MPSVSRQQQKLMHGIASGSIRGGGNKPTRAVAQKFAQADHARGPTKLPATTPKALGKRSSGAATPKRASNTQFERADMASDRRAGIRENSPQDMRIDARAQRVGKQTPASSAPSHGMSNAAAMGSQLQAAPKRGRGGSGASGGGYY